MKKVNISINFELVDGFETKNTIARVFYPNEGNKILIKKGLNIIEFSEAIHHEIGHLFDWYISNNKQSASKIKREKNADVIGNAIRFRENSNAFEKRKERGEKLNNKELLSDDLSKK